MYSKSKINLDRSWKNGKLITFAAKKPYNGLTCIKNDGPIYSVSQIKKIPYGPTLVSCLACKIYNGRNGNTPPCSRDKALMIKCRRKLAIGCYPKTIIKVFSKSS